MMAPDDKMHGPGAAIDPSSAMLAHELNQPLTAVMLYLQAAVTASERQSRCDMVDVLDLVKKALIEAERALAIAERMQSSKDSGC